MSRLPRLVVCMGVSGCGKSALGEALANETGAEFIDADDFHSDHNKSLMVAGTPLTDADRAPWMTAICEHLRQHLAAGHDCVLAHSGLRRAHREQLRMLGFASSFLHLDGERDVLASRLAGRQGHFASVDLLDSQLASLQSTKTEDDVVTLDFALPVNELVARARRTLRNT